MFELPPFPLLMLCVASNGKTRVILVLAADNIPPIASEILLHHEIITSETSERTLSREFSGTSLRTARFKMSFVERPLILYWSGT
jgi:hypothetical protein